MERNSQKCLVCTPLVATTVSEMLIQLRMAKESGADVAELRVDHITDFNVEVDLPVLLQDRALPVIVTPRAKWECKGDSIEGYDGSEETRQGLLRKAYELGADYIDVELKVAGEFVKTLKDSSIKSGTKIIVSFHNWECTPSQEEIGATIEQMWATGADVVKFVTTAEDITDVARVFQFLSEAKPGRPTIGLAMGPRGTISRLLSPKFGGYLTFGELSKNPESVPTVEDLIDVYRVKSMDRDTVVCGVVGTPVYHSKGPILHNRGFAELNLNFVYVHFLVDDFAHFMSVYSESHFRGFSISMPYKEDARRLCGDQVEYVAKGIGAVNTVIREKDGELRGYNTDCAGALSAIEDGLRHSGLATTSAAPLKDKLFVVIGAGGAGKALAYGAKERHARVVVVNRTYERAKALAESISAEALELHKIADFRPETGMILANGTSVGMQPDVTKSPISKDALSAYSLVFDAVYTPKETQLLKDAVESGAVDVSGEEMFYRQAFAQFQHFTGVPAPERAMRDALSIPCVALKGALSMQTMPVSAQCSIGVFNKRGSVRVSQLVCQERQHFSHLAHVGMLVEKSQAHTGCCVLIR